jgi:hypothetical protein
VYKEILAAAQNIRRPVIAVNVLGTLTRHGPELTALTTALQRYQWFGLRPVVVATEPTEQSPDMATIRDRYGPVLIHSVSDFLDRGWQLVGPDGVVVATKEPLADLFGRADVLDLPADGYALPPVLAGLLSQNTWGEGEQHLRAHVEELLRSQITDSMHDLRQREPEDRKVRAYDVVLQLVRAAGGVTASRSRFIPAKTMPNEGVEPELLSDGRLRETFVFDYLEAKSTRKERARWDDRLMRLRWSGLLTGDQMSDLAWGVVETGEHPGPSALAARGAKTDPYDHGAANAALFTAIEMVLRIDESEVQRIAEAEGDRFDAENPVQKAISLVKACRDPQDRLAWLYRIGDIQSRVSTERADILQILLYTLSSCD